MTTREALWALASECPAIGLQWLALGWRLGLLDGRDEGFRAAELDMAMRWREMWLASRDVLRGPTFAELQARREEAAW
jgi:hypothetical protein